MRLGLITLGFSMTIAQIIMMRELVAAFYGNELLLGLVLFAWLAWVAVGAWGLARWADRSCFDSRIFAAGLMLAALFLSLEMALVRGARGLLNVTPGAFVEFGPMVITTLLVLAPLCILGGFLFTLGARLTIERGGTAGQAYVWEGAGAVVGGLLFSFIFIRSLDAFQSALLVSAINLAVAAAIWFGRSILALLLGVGFAIVAIPIGQLLQQNTLGWQWGDIVFAADSLYGRIVVQAREGQRAFYENGLLAFETQSTFAEEVVHFPLLLHPEPSHVLLIGGGVAGDLREILKHPVSSVTYVELDPLLIEVAIAQLSQAEAMLFNDPRVEIQYADGRLFVKQAALDRSGAFEAIILDLPEPSTGGLNRFYTREFFAEVRQLLKPGGIFALGLPAAENYWSPELARRNGSVFQTLSNVFPETLALPGEHNFFLASDAPILAEPNILAERMIGRGIETLWVTPAYIEYVLTTDRFAETGRELAATAGIRLNEDLKPICYYYDLALWLSRFYPNLRPVFEGAGLVNLWWVVVPLAGLVAVSRWRNAARIPIAIAAFGFTQMTLQVVILFAFQVLHGYVYAQVSLIVTTFMAGLVLGGATSNWFVKRHAVRSGKLFKWALAGLLLGVIAFSALFPMVIAMTALRSAAMFVILSFLAGQLTGMAFPLALAMIRGTPALVTGTLYGADLAGGCMGALLGSIFLIPLLGIPQTCTVLALVALAGLLALI